MSPNPFVAKYEFGPGKIIVFGRGNDPHGPISWGMHYGNGFHLNTMIPDALVKNLGLESNGQTAVYCPNCTKFNAQIITDPADFHHSLSVRDSLIGHQFIFHHGPKVAGLEIPRGSIALFTTADCPVLAAYLRHPTKSGANRTIAVHAGRDELIERDMIHGVLPPARTHYSVVDKMIELLTGENFAHLEFYIICGIRQGDFLHPADHPVYGQKNAELIAHLRSRYRSHADMICEDQTGAIGLRELISRQLEEYGISRSHIHSYNLDTSNKLLWSNRHHGPLNPLDRNLIGVMHG